MSGLAGLPRLAAVAVRVAFAARAAYRWDFLLSAAVALALEAVTPVVTLLIYGMGSSFPGWTAPEALLLQGTFLLARGVAFPCFFGMVWTVFEGVREGTFELTLLKPRSPLLVTLATSFDVEGLTRLLGGGVLVGLSVSRLPAPGLPHLLAYLGLLLLSVAVLFAFALFMAGSLFVWVGNGRVFEVMESALLFAQYPGSIYGRAFQVVLAVVVPVGMVAFLPAQALLGRAGPLTLASAGASVAFVGVALLFWRAMLRRYASGGG